MITENRNQWSIEHQKKYKSISIQMLWQSSEVKPNTGSISYQTSAFCLRVDMTEKLQMISHKCWNDSVFKFSLWLHCAPMWTRCVQVEVWLAPRSNEPQTVATSEPIKQCTLHFPLWKLLCLFHDWLLPFVLGSWEQPWRTCQVVDLRLWLPVFD